jgi:hypothetical protein
MAVGKSGQSRGGQEKDIFKERGGRSARGKTMVPARRDEMGMGRSSAMSISDADPPIRNSQKSVSWYIY